MAQKHVESKNTSRCAVMVLGMHRSGTSALAGLLTRLGGDGPVNPLVASPSNPLGHFEVEAIFRLQDELLASAGTSWDDYAPLPESWFTSIKAQEFRNRLKELLQTEFGSSSFFIIKDPRNCRLMPFWQKTLSEMNISPVFVHTHRNPVEVAQSLHKRNGFDPEYGYLLWLRHILDAEEGSRNQRRSFTSYDRILKSWPTEIEKISADLDISWPKYSGTQLSELGSMIRPDLRNNISDGVIHSKHFSIWFRETFDIFTRWANTGEDKKDQVTLDQIRSDFNQSVTAFAGTVYVKGSKQAHADYTALHTLKVEHAKLMEEMHRQRNMLDQQKSDLDNTRLELKAVLDDLAAEKNESATIIKELAAAQSEIQVLQSAVSTRDADIAQCQTSIKQAQDKSIQQTTQTEILNETIKKLKTSVTQSNARVNALLGSRSWRMTAPVRSVMRRLQKYGSPQ